MLLRVPKLWPIKWGVFSNMGVGILYSCPSCCLPSVAETVFSQKSQWESHRCVFSGAWTSFLDCGWGLLQSTFRPLASSSRACDVSAIEAPLGVFAVTACRLGSGRDSWHQTGEHGEVCSGVVNITAFKHQAVFTSFLLNIPGCWCISEFKPRPGRK